MFVSVLFGCLVLVLVNVIANNSAEESPTGALLKFPYVQSTHPLYGLSWIVAPSQFGYHDYGGSLEGLLVLPKNTSYHTQCNKEASESNEYIHWVNDWNVESDNKNIIMLIDRGDCYFVDKVENAQSYGITGVIVIDYKVENLFTMWPPEDFDDDINIPSVLLDEPDGEILMSALNVKNWNAKNIELTTYPTTDNMNWTIARIEWGLPHEDDRVEYSLWTSANDPDSVEFKKNFKWTAIDLDSRNKTVFTPHFYLLNGSHWNCDSGSYRCGRQCTNGGRYCSVDPEYDLSIGLDGMDVVQENLRQMCLWEFADLDENNDTIWWDYSILWDKNCFSTDNPANTFTESCSYSQMDKLDPTSGLKTAVRDCVQKSGNYGYKSGENSMLEDETRLREVIGIYALPTVTVNEFMIHGNIDCNEVTVDHCQVLDAICAGYLNGTEPPECYWTPSPTDITCDSSLMDCLGVCYGNAEIDCNGECDGSSEYDYCGICLDSNDPEWNSCVGCDGTINSGKVYDCEGICDGGKEINVCGYCLNPNDSTIDFNTYGKDCRGVCSTDGNYEIDLCNNCKSVSDFTFNNCVGCDGIINSNKTYDCNNICGGNYTWNECGFCMDPSDLEFNIYGKDCSGVCEGNKEIDLCNNCKSNSDPTFNGCVGCDGIANSGLVNDCAGNCNGNFGYSDCGICVDTTVNNWTEAGKDCRGICNGGKTNCSPNNENNNNNSSNINSLIIVIIGCIAFIIICIAGLIIFKLWRRQQKVNNRFGTLIKQYQFMDENNTINNGGITNPKRIHTTKKGISVPDDEIDEEEDVNL